MHWLDGWGSHDAMVRWMGLTVSNMMQLVLAVSIMMQWLEGGAHSVHKGLSAQLQCPSQAGCYHICSKP